MKFTVTPIGVNAAFSTKGFNTNYLIESSQGRFLIDCGSTAASAMASMGAELHEIDSVYISHVHVDHIGGLFQLGMQRYFRKKPRPKIYVHASFADRLWENCLLGPLAIFKDLNGSPGIAKKETFFEFIPVKESDAPSATIAGLSLHLIEVEHGTPTYGVVIDSRVFVTTDMIFQPELLDQTANRFGLEAIFQDCAFREAEKPVHATYEELLTLPEDLRELLILTHYEEEIDPRSGDWKLQLGIAGKSYRF